MKQFQKLFVFLFIISIFVGTLHHIEHNHLDGETCEVCALVHTPALLNDVVTQPYIYKYFEPFYASFTSTSYLVKIFLKSRSPPIS